MGAAVTGRRRRLRSMPNGGSGGGANLRKRPRAAAATAYTTTGYTAKVVGNCICITASAVRAVMPGPYGRLFGLQDAKKDAVLWGASAGAAAGRCRAPGR